MARKKGDITGSGSNRKRWNGRRWVPAPVSSSSRSTSTRTRAQNRRSSSSSSSTTIPASRRPADMRQGVIYGDAGNNTPKPLTENQKLARSNRTMDRTPTKTPPTKTPPTKTPPTKKPTPSKPTTSTKKPTPSSAAQSLRSGRSPDKAPTKPKKKVYGSTGRKDLKQSARMAAALKDLKVRKYKK